MEARNYNLFYEDPTEDRERLSWFMLSRLPTLGPHSFWRLVHHFGTADRALQNLPQRWRLQQHRLWEDRCIQERETVARHKGRMVMAFEADYPALLKTIQDPPPVLTFFGEQEGARSFPTGPVVAMVGGRNASLAGQQFAKQIAKDLSEAHITVVSGMARGIDAAAHQGCLEGPGATYAVLAGGVDVIYPQEHKSLYAAIQKKGSIISEMPLGCAPTPQLFPRRNRVISGLSHATVVIEASLKSGSLITARHALGQNREVLAVPGFPSDSRHHGSNALLRQGAALVESADDILTILAEQNLLPVCLEKPLGEGLQDASLEPSIFSDMPSKDLTTLRGRVFSLLGAAPVRFGDLLTHVQEPIGALQAVLLDLELAGDITRTADYIVRVSGGQQGAYPQGKDTV